jgi:hypothetical protein
MAMPAQSAELYGPLLLLGSLGVAFDSEPPKSVILGIFPTFEYFQNRLVTPIEVQIDVCASVKASSQNDLLPISGKFPRFVKIESRIRFYSIGDRDKSSAAIPLNV